MEPKHRSRNREAERVPGSRVIRELRREVHLQGKQIDGLIAALEELADAVFELPYFSKEHLGEYVDDLEELDHEQETRPD